MRETKRTRWRDVCTICVFCLAFLAPNICNASSSTLAEELVGKENVESSTGLSQKNIFAKGQKRKAPQSSETRPRKFQKKVSPEQILAVKSVNKDCRGSSITTSRALSQKRNQKTCEDEFAELLPQTSTIGDALPESTTSKKINISGPVGEMDLRVQDELSEGTRRWVKNFETLGSENPDDVENWHREMNEKIQAINNEHTLLFHSKSVPRKKYIGNAYRNFLLARLTVILPGKGPEIIPIPYIFTSGWPSDDDLGSGGFDQLRDALRKKLGDGFSSHKIKTLTATDSTRDNNCHEEKTFRKTIKGLFSKKVVTPMIGKTRRDALVKLSDSSLKYYFCHTEQALRRVVHDKISDFMNTGIRPYITNLYTTFVLDICSYYDMCWCCSDSLARCSLLKEEHKDCKLVVRCTGTKPYFDRPFYSYNGENGEAYCLRHHRHSFDQYAQKEGAAWILGDSDEEFRPYTAQAVVEDF